MTDSPELFTFKRITAEDPLHLRFTENSSLFKVERLDSFHNGWMIYYSRVSLPFAFVFIVNDFFAAGESFTDRKVTQYGGLLRSI